MAVTERRLRARFEFLSTPIALRAARVEAGSIVYSGVAFDLQELRRAGYPQAADLVESRTPQRGLPLSGEAPHPPRRR